ncbi:MAG: glycosyl hydrolase family 18 protein [Trueperaceae bacterium]
MATRTASRAAAPRWALVGALAALLTTAAAESPQAQPGEAIGWCVAVWFPSSEHPGGFDSIMANTDVIDVVFPFWFTPDAQGRILTRAGQNWPAQVQAWREAGLLVMPSVFTTHSAFLAEPLVSEHIAALVELVELHDFDGLDLDYEEFALSTREPFSAFVERLSAELRARGRLLSVTVHAKTEESPVYEGAAAQDWPRLAAAADMFNVMTYDYTHRNAPPGPVADRAWVAAVVEHGLITVGGHKLLVGLPFYGYVWKRDRPPAVATTWESAVRQMQQFGLPEEREPGSGELVVRLDVTGLPRQVTYVSDATTTAGRLADLAANSRLAAGVAIWGVGGEDPGSWQALREARPAPCRLGDRLGAARPDDRSAPQHPARLPGNLQA